MRGYLGNQGRNRPEQRPPPRRWWRWRRRRLSGRRDRDGNRDTRGNNGGRHDELPHDAEQFDGDNDAEIISPAELTQSQGFDESHGAQGEADS